MSELQDNLKKTLTDVENNLKNKEDIEYVKTQICNIYTMFLDEFDKLEEKSTQNMDNILLKYKILEERIKKVENSVDKIEDDIYINDEEDCSFDITCPYCDVDFFVDCSDELKNSVVCPECNNTIELDWNEQDSCSHDCCGCNHDCKDEQNNEDNEDM